MTDDERTSPPDLAALIRQRLHENEWSYRDMSAAIDGQLTHKRLAQLGEGRRTKEFPEPRTLILIAQALELAPAAVVLAAARSVGIDARTDADELADLLPPGTHRLPGRVRVAIAALIRAVVDEGDAPSARAWIKPPEPPTGTYQAPGPRQPVTIEWADGTDATPPVREAGRE